MDTRQQTARSTSGRKQQDQHQAVDSKTNIKQKTARPTSDRRQQDQHQAAAATPQNTQRHQTATQDTTRRHQHRGRDRSTRDKLSKLLRHLRGLDGRQQVPAMTIESVDPLTTRGHRQDRSRPPSFICRALAPSQKLGQRANVTRVHCETAVRNIFVKYLYQAHSPT